MASKKSKFTLEIEALFKGEKAKQNAKNMANDIAAMLDNMWNSGDAVSYFKDLVQYISMIDTAMDAFRKEHGDDFERMFAGLDTGLQQELEKLFRTTKSELVVLDQLRKKIADTQAKIPTDGQTKLDKSEADALRQEAKKIQAEVEQALGVKIKIEGNTGALKILDILSGEIDKFARNWADVNDRVSKGLGFGSGGSGSGSGSGPAGGGNILDELDELSKELQDKIKKLDGDIDELRKKKEELEKVLKNDKEYSTDMELNTESLKDLVNEYKRLSNVIDNADKESDEYYQSLLKIVGVSAKLKKAYSQLNEAPDNIKDKFRNTYNGTDKDGNKLTLYGELDRVNRTHDKKMSSIYDIADGYGDLLKIKQEELELLHLDEQRIAKNRELGLTYKKLAQYAVAYMDKASKGDSLTKYDRDEMAQLEKEMINFAKAKKLKQAAVKDVFKSVQAGELADEDAMLEKLCHALGVDIPRNAKKAREAIKSVGRAGDGMGSGDGTGHGSGSGGEITNIDFSSLENTIKAEISSIASKLDSVLEVKIVDDKTEAIQNAVDGIKTILNGIESAIDAQLMARKQSAEQVEVDNMKKNLQGLLSFVNDFNDNRAAFGLNEGEYHEQETSASIFSDGTIHTNYGEDGTVPWDRITSVLLSNLSRNSLMDIHSHPWGTFSADNTRYANDAFSGSRGDLGASRTTKALGTQIEGMITGNILRTFDVSKLTEAQLMKFRDNLAKNERNIPNVPEWQPYVGYDSGRLYYKSQKTLAGQHKVTEIFESMMYDALKQTGISQDKIDNEIFKKYDLTNEDELTSLATRLVKLASASQGAVDPISRLSHIIEAFGGDVTSQHAKDMFTSFKKGELTAADVYNDLTGNKHKLNQDTIDAINVIDSANTQSPTLSSLSQIVGVLSSINSSLKSIESSVRHDSEQKIDSTIKDVLDIAKGNDGRNLTKDIDSIFNPLNISEYQNEQIGGLSYNATSDFEKSLRHSKYSRTGMYKDKNAVQIADDVTSKFAKALSYTQDTLRQVDLYESRKGADSTSKSVRKAAEERYKELTSDSTVKSLLNILSNAKQEVQDAKTKAGLNDQENAALSGELYKALQGALSDVATESTLSQIVGLLNSIQSTLAAGQAQVDTKDRDDNRQQTQTLSELQAQRKDLERQMGMNEQSIKMREKFVNDLAPTLDDSRYTTSGKKEATDQLRNAFNELVRVRAAEYNGEPIGIYDVQKAQVAWMKSYKEAERQKVADSTLTRYDHGITPIAEQSEAQLKRELEAHKQRLNNAKQEKDVLKEKSAELDKQIEMEEIRAKKEERRTQVQEKRRKRAEADGTTPDEDKQKDQDDKTPDSDASEEIQQLAKLEKKVKEVTEAVEAKTKAFQTEATEVGNAVTKEIGDLNRLIEKLKEVEQKIDAMKTALKGASDVVDTQSQDGDKKPGGTSGKDYALDATLDKTNSILQSILTAINSNEAAGNVAQALEGVINELQAAAKSIKASADELGRKIKDGPGDKPGDQSDGDKPDGGSDDKPKDEKKPKTFDELKTEQLDSFDKYKNSIRDSVHLTGEFRGELDQLHDELNNVGDAKGLEEWQQKFKNFQSDLDRYTDASKRVLTGQINSITKDARDALKGIDLENTTINEKDDPEGYARQLADQERIAQGFKDIQIASDICANQIKNDQNMSTEAFLQAKQALVAQKQELLKLVHEYKTNYGFINSGGKKGNNYGSTAIIQETSRYNQLQQYATDQSSGFKDSAVFKKQMAEYTAAYQRLIDIRNRLSSKPVLTDRDVQEFNDAKKAAASYGKELDKMIAKSNKLAANSFKDSAIGSDVKLNDSFSRKQALTDFVTNMHDARESTIRFSNDYNECTFKMKNGDGTWTKMTATLDKFSNKMYSSAGEVTKYGTAIGEFAGALKGEFLKLGRYMIASFGFEEVIQAVRTGITYVKEIDDALTDLKKVTNETDASYERFLQRMSQTAGVVGSTVAELTTMAAEWSRLGYSMSEAASLAESTAVLLNVSEFEDATSASEALISTIQAFGYAADDSMHVVDMLNEVGNNFAISSDGIATALQDSASALMAGGNSMEEATAMIAAANKVTQDPSKVGAGLRTISLRLRGTEVSGQLEELGEETDGLVSSSKMRDKIKGLSGVDILTDTGAYKSTYDIIYEIAGVWESMNDMDQAALLELMAGKNRSNIMAALLTNMEDLKDAKDAALDAEGSAYRENEAYLDSIQGRVDIFMNALQTFWMNLISSDMAKGVVDLGTSLIQFLDTAHGKLTALGAAFAIFLKATNNVDMFKQGLNGLLGTNFKQSKAGMFGGMLSSMASTGKEGAKTFMSAFSTDINKNATGMGISKAISANIKDPNTRINMRNAITSALGVNNLSEINELTDAQKKQAKAAIEANTANTKLGKAQSTVAMNAAGLTQATTKSQKAMLAQSYATIGANKAMTGLKQTMAAHPFLTVAAAAMVLVAAFDKLIVTSQEASEKSTDKFNEIADLVDTTQSNVKDLETELSTIDSKIAQLEGRTLSFTDAQELERLRSQKSALESNLDIQENLLEAQNKIKNEAAVTAMKDFVKASNEGAESAEKTGKAIGVVAGGLLAIGGIAAAAFTGGTSLAATVEGLGMMTTAAIVGGGAYVGSQVGAEVGQTLNAATVSNYEDWYQTYKDAYEAKSKAASDAYAKYEKDAGNMDKYDEWQKLEQESIDIQSKMYDNLTQMQNYYSGIEYGQSEAMDRELDAWYNFMDKMNISGQFDGVAKAGAKANAIERLFGKNASQDVQDFREEIEELIEAGDEDFDIAAAIEGRDELQELENHLEEIGITTEDISDYFRKTGEIGAQAFSDLSNEATAAETAISNLKNILDNVNTNEGYETRNTGLEEMKTLMEKGAIGSESKLWNIASAMGFTYDSAKTIEENADALADYIVVRDDWYNTDDEGNWDVTGAQAFAKDIEKAVKNSKELQKLDIKWDFDEATGALSFDFNNMQFDEIVEALSKTEEAAGLTSEEFMDMITHIGQFYDVKWSSGNDIVYYLESLRKTGADAEAQLEAVKEPLTQLLSQQGLDSKAIEKYLTGDGALDKLPEDLQNAVTEYRKLREEVEKPVDNKTTKEAKKTTEKTTLGERIKNFFKGDKTEEKVEQEVDVEVKADEVDTTDVQEKAKDAVEKAEKKAEPAKMDQVVEVEATLEEIAQSVNDLKDKEITIDVKVKGLKDVERLNKNLDLDSKIKGNTNRLAEYAKSAEILSKLDDNITTEVKANLFGNVTEKFDFKIDNLQTFAEGAKALKGVGSITSNVTANVFGNVTEEFEFKLNNLKTFADSAVGLKDIGNVASNVSANVEGNVLDEFEFRINNLKTFTDSAKDISSIGEDVQAKVTANVAGNVITTAEMWIDNLKTFVDSAQNIDTIGEDTKAQITANVGGSVITTPEMWINNLKTFTESAEGIKDVGEDVKAQVTANVGGNVITTAEMWIDNLKKFTESAEGIQGVGEDVKAKVTANIAGNVVNTAEMWIDNLKKFTESAEGIQEVGEDVKAKVTADIEGNVKDNFEFQIDNLKTFVESAQGVKEIGEDVKAKVTADIDGSVFTTYEAWINNLKTFVDSAQGVEEIGENVYAKVTADLSGTAITTPEDWIDNLKVFAEGASMLKDIGSFAIDVKADVSGTVVGTPESWINNLKVFAEGAKALDGVDSFEVEVTANLFGNVDDISESRISNLEVFANSADTLKDVDSFTTEVTAKINEEITDEQITHLEELANVIAQLSPTPSVTVSIKANVATDAITNATTLLTELSNSGVFKDYTATVTLTVDQTQLTIATQNLNNFSFNEKILKISEQGSAAVMKALSDINNKKLNNKTVKVNYQTGTMPNIPSWPGGRDGNTQSPWPLVNGTAHAKGTAFAGGNWGAPRTEQALVGELGPEMVVRGSRWFTVGENGAEFTDIRKGDIIFNHKQTEQLFSNGYVASRGKLQGDANANGTAHAQGTAYAGGKSTLKKYSFDSSSSSVNKTTKRKTTKKAKDQFEEVFDWFEIRIEEINEDLDLMAAKLENAASLKSKNSLLNDMIKTNKSELKTLEKGKSLYNKYATDLYYKIPKKYREKAKDGSIAIEDFAGDADEKTLEAIKNYREWAQKVADLRKQIQETKKEIRELAKQKIDNIADVWDHRISVYDTSIQERNQNYIDLTEESGNIASTVNYERLKVNERQKKTRLENKRNAMQAELDKQVKLGNIQRGTEEWWDAVEAIQAVDSEIDQCEINLESYQNAINDIHWDTFDEVLNRFGYAEEEISSLLDMMSDADMFKTKTPNMESWGANDVEYTDEAMASMALYLEQMEIAKEKQQEYADQIAYLQEHKDDYSESEYQAKMAELTKGQYDSIEAYKDAEKALVDLEKARVDYIKEGIEKQIEAEEELIQKQKEALEAEKDLHDFQRSVEDSSKNIADIQRKLAALAGDNSAAAQAKRRQLEAELAEAQQGQEDLYYDRSIENKQNALDNQLEVFTKAKEEEIEALEKGVEEVDRIVSEATSMITGQGEQIVNILNAIAAANGVTVSQDVQSGAATTSETATSDISDDVASETAAGDAAATEAADDIADTELAVDDEVKDKFQPGAKVYVKKGTQAYKANGKENFKVGYNTSYTVVSTDNATGMTKVKTSDGKIRYFKTSDLSDTSFGGSGTSTGSGNGSGSGSGSSTKYYKKYTGNSSSIVTALKKIGVNSSYSNRKKIAKANDIKNYKGTAQQNTTMLNLLKKGKLKKYAKGSLGILQDQLALIDELGEELQLVPDGTGRLEYLKKGTGIVPADLTANLMEWGKLNPQSMIEQNRPAIGASPAVHATEINVSIQYGDMLKIDTFKGDNPDEIAKIVAKQFEKHTKDLNSALRKYVR